MALNKGKSKKEMVKGQHFMKEVDQVNFLKSSSENYPLKEKTI